MQTQVVMMVLALSRMAALIMLRVTTIPMRLVMTAAAHIPDV
jgi:hypothetical protein